MKLPTREELLQAGTFYGHKKEYLDPRAKEYIWTIKDRIAIIDVNKTLQSLEEALHFIQKETSSGREILFVGTKLQARELIKKIVEETGMPGLWQRWPGGLLTNFQTVLKSLKKMKGLDEKIKDPSFEKLPRKERMIVQDQSHRLHALLDGLKNLTQRPDILFIVDVAEEKGAALEAQKLGLQVVGICDTNANPQLCDYPILANDDSFKSLEMILVLVKEAVLADQKAIKIPKEKKDVKKDKKT